MTTTLNAIRAHSPCQDGWAKLLKHLGKTQGDDEPLALLTVLDSSGLDDAIWCLRTEPQLAAEFALAVARRVEHLHPAAKACNDVTERYLNGTATEVELGEARAAAAVSYTSAAAAAAAASTAAADAAAYAASAAAARAAYAALDAAADSEYAVLDSAAEREAQVEIFKGIFA